MLRLSRSSLALVAAIALISPLAAAEDGGQDGARDAAPDVATSHDAASHDAASRDAVSDVAVPERDAAVADAARMCIAIGEPCAASEKCCVEDAYCGSFGGTGNSLVCGLDSSNALSTGSCSASGASGLDTLTLLGLVGLGVIVTRRRRRLGVG